MADDSFCEVCGDAGGALSLVLCENVEEGCPAGIHLYCCVPLRTELPTDNWYCSQCTARRAQADVTRMKREAAAAAERKRLKRQRREEGGGGRPRAATAAAAPQQQQQQQQQPRQDQQQHAAPPAAGQAPAAHGVTARPATPAPNGAMQARRSGLAASLARSSSKLGTASRPSAAAAASAAAAGARPAPAAAAPPQPAATAHPVASSDVLTSLFASLQREDEASQEQRRQQGRKLDGTSRSMARAMAEREERRRAVVERFALDACQAAGGLWQGSLCLPLAQEAGVWQAGGVECFGIPGNPMSGAAASHLAALGREAAAGRQPAPRLLSMDELGLKQDAAHEEAAFLLALGAADPAAAAQWSALWDVLYAGRQAVGIELPADAAAAAVAAMRGDGGDGGGDGGDASGLFLALVPNVLDRQSRSLLGLVAVPMQQLARAPAGGAPQRSCLRRPAAAAAAVPGGQPAQRQPRFVGWADAGREDNPTSPAAARLELALGAHYATPQRLAVQAARPTRLPTIHASLRTLGGGKAPPPGPLAGLQVAVVGFDRSNESIKSLLGNLQALGASTFANKANLVDVLVVHPLLLQQHGLEGSSCFPLGLAHMLAGSRVHAYADSSLSVLHHLARHRRRLHGAEWLEAGYKLVFPDGLCVVLDAPALLGMQPAALSSLLSHMRQLAAAAEVPHCVWAVAAPPEDVAALRAAAAAGHAHAAENWRLWQAASGLARELGDREMEAKPSPDGPAAVVQHALVVARNAASYCRLVYLCSGDAEVQRQADLRDTILSGGSDDLLHFLRTRLEQRRQQQQRQQEAQQRQQQRQQQQAQRAQAQQAQQQARPQLQPALRALLQPPQRR